jgi:ribonucleoside-diphosphate reductase alpha chain
MTPASSVTKAAAQSTTTQESDQSIATVSKLKFKRHFTVEEKDPFDTVEWNKRDVTAGTFSQKEVEAPVIWSDQAVGIVAKLYFATIDGVRESSIKTLIKRVVNKIIQEGMKFEYFGNYNGDDSGQTLLNEKNFLDELTYILLHQYASFNSPVWFNFGVPGRKQCASACFLLNVEDKLLGPESISEWQLNESAIFKMGAGSGVNLSKLRGSREGLSTGGFSSGPIPFIRSADANSGSIKSGGTRRAAKLIQLDVDHPDILDFIDSKVREDERMRVLAEAGINMDPSTPEGERNIAESTSFQNANISVRVSDKFMNAAENGEFWQMPPRIKGGDTNTIGAKHLFSKISEATWKCADPGIIFHDTVNKWHTTPSLGQIETTNPCCEVHINSNSSCNLASMNLVKFLDKNTNEFYFDDFYQVVDTMITAMDITCCFSELSTEKLEENTRNLRQLGLGYSNLGAALMIQGMPYDSDEGRDWAASVTSLMTARAYRRSAEIADSLGAFAYYWDNENVMGEVIQKHMNAAWDLPPAIGDGVREQWDHVSAFHDSGYRNSQISVLAPTGTISFLMDCDTTGCEPAYSLVTYKSLAGGGHMTLVNHSVERSLENLGYDKATIKIAMESVKHSGNIRGIDPEHLKIFQTASGEDSISPEGHLNMVAAIQPHISGAASKTLNVPESTKVEEIEDIYMKAWKLGIKCVSVYRDGSKSTQVLSTKKEETNSTKLFDPKENQPDMNDLDKPSLMINLEENTVETLKPYRKKMPTERSSLTHKFSLAGHEGYITAGLHEDGTLGEIFLNGIGKEGSTLRGMMDAWAIAISLGLQYGVPLESFANKFSHMRFEPEGITDNSEIRIAKSLVDYIMRWLVSKFGDEEMKKDLGVMVIASTEPEGDLKNPQTVYVDEPLKSRDNYLGKICSCGSILVRTGTCFSCPNCGASSGCG